MGGLALREIASFIFNFYLFGSFALIVAAVTFIKLNRMQSVYQKSLVRKVKKIKQRKQEYLNEKNPEKLAKKEKNHAKAVKKLEKRIKRVMFFNRNLIITNPVLTSDDNLALPKQTPFTFNSKVDELIKKFNEKHKRHKTVNTPNVKKNKVVKPRKLTNDEIKQMQETKTKTPPKEENKSETKAQSNLVKSIYAEEEDLFTN